ncbi:MAG: hypothetical protein ABI200_04455 [Gaiellales bacterium]
MSEQAFGIVEIAVVALIALALMGALISQLRGAKSATYQKETLTIAASYDQAIAAYQADHANRNPPNSAMRTLSGKPAGPENLLGKPYLKQLPDSVAAGRIVVRMSCTAPTAASRARGWIAYCPGADPTYAIRAYTRRASNNAWVLNCQRGNTTATPRCQ